MADITKCPTCQAPATRGDGANGMDFYRYDNSEVVGLETALRSQIEITNTERALAERLARTAAPWGSQQSGSGEATVSDTDTLLLRSIAKEARHEHDKGDGHFSTEEIELLERIALAAQNSPPASGELK